MGIFDDVLTNAVRDLSLDGGPDEEAGSADALGWRGIMYAVSTEEVQRAAAEAGETLSDYDLLTVSTSAGVILSLDSQGSFSAHWYATAAELETAWAEERETVHPAFISILDDWVNGNRKDAIERLVDEPLTKRDAVRLALRVAAESPDVARQILRRLE